MSSTTSTSSGLSWLLQPFEQPCVFVFVFVYVCVDTTHTHTHIGLGLCTKICMCLCVWLVDSCFQLKLYAKCLLHHQQDMHLVVSTYIFLRPVECVTLSQSETTIWLTCCHYCFTLLWVRNILPNNLCLLCSLVIILSSIFTFYKLTLMYSLVIILSSILTPVVTS